MLKFKILLICLAFSLICAITKQLYDDKYCKNTSYHEIIVRICLSAITGVITSLIGIEYVNNYYILVGLSGLAGLFGSQTIKIITRFLLGQKVIRIQITDDDEPIEITHNGKRLDDEVIDGIINTEDEDK